MAPADYVAVRDSCLKRKREKKKKLSDKDVQACKKMAAIWYFKKHGKPVTHSDASELPCISDAIELEILIEQLDRFGTLENYEKSMKVENG